MAHGLILFTWFSALLALAAHLYGIAETPYAGYPYPPMSRQSSVAFLFLSTGILFAQSGKGLVRILIAHSVAGLMARLLVSASILIPFLVGLFRLRGERLGYYSLEFGVAITAMSSTVILFFLVWWCVSWIDKAEKAQSAAQQAIAERAAVLQKLAAIVENSEDAIYGKDLNGIITSWNKGAEKIYGYPEDEVIGRSVAMIAPSDSPEAFPAVLASVIQNERAVQLETVHCQKDGQRVDVSLTISPMSDASGTITGTATIARDITERKRAERVIEQLNEDVKRQKTQLEFSNKELEAFSYSVSHDLRTPLRAIEGFSRILMEDYREQLDEDAQRYLQIVRANTIKMDRLINDLLAFSRLSRQPVQKQLMHPESLVQSVLQDLQGEQNEHHAHITVSDLPACQGDPALLKQVWLNLIANALKYSRQRANAKVEIGSTGENGETVYYIKDNGVGFDMQYEHKLFGVFQRLHRAEDFEGTGVGLAIVQRIIHRHGGRVWAEGAVDKGAAFYFTMESGKTS